LERRIKPNTKLLIINFPHNPTGYLPSAEDFRRIIRIAEKSGAYVFSDEMYRFLELNCEQTLPSACEVYGRGISLFGMSKTFGLAGARLGWLISKDKTLYEKMLAFKDYTTICSSAPSELLSLIALRSKDKIIPRHLSRIRKNLSVLRSFFSRQSNRFSWVSPTAGTVGFARILGGESSTNFCERVVQEAGIMLLPSIVYGYGDKHFRVGFGRENMPEALGKLENYLRQI
jgi:aspartate/methionine/tyrosine aminotransferase